MIMQYKYVAVILNRNLGRKCDDLRNELLEIGFSEIVIVDSSPDPILQSEYITIKANDANSIKRGLRINRGFNLGINYAVKNYNPDWILCLPVDSQIIKIDLKNFEKEAFLYPKIVAYSMINPNHPYLSLLKSNIGLVWNIEEGPIFLKSSFLKNFEYKNKITLFDNHNFRSYLSFKEIALRIYGNDKSIGIYKSFLIEEREEYLLNFAELMKTESYSLNKELLIKEGEIWLRQKYGLFDRWSFETILRLIFDEFLLRNPDYKEIAL